MSYEQLSGSVDISIFEAALEISSEIIWVLYPERKECLWLSSPKNRDKYGIQESKTHSDLWANNIHPDDKQRVTGNFNVALADPSIAFFKHEYRIKGSNNEYFYIADKMQFERNPEGIAIKVTGVWRDITGSINHRNSLAEEELKQVNEQLHQNIKELCEREFILNESQRLARIASWYYDLESNSMFWSDEMYNIYGLDKSFKVHRPSEMFQLYDSSSSQLVSEIFTDVEALPIDITASLTTPLGFKKWVRITAHPVIENNELKKIIGLTYDITHSKESEERLKRSEEKFAKAFQNNPDLMTIHRESDLVIIDTNFHVEKIMGYTREELVGRCARDFNFFHHNDDKNAFYEDYSDDGEASIETLWKRKDGKLFLAQITSTRVEINGENYSLNIIKDISSQKADKEKFQKAFELSPDLMMIYREENLILIDANSKLESMTGYSREEIINQSSNNFKLWAHKSELDFFLNTLKYSDYISMDATFQRKNGIPFYGVISTTRIQLFGTNHLLTVVRDITEQKTAEIKIRENETKLNAIINNTDLNIWSIDTEYRITAFNSAFNETMQHLLGKSFATGMNVLEDSRGLLEDSFIRFWESLYNRAFTGEIVSEEFEFHGATSHTSLHPIIDNGKVIGASIYSRDITGQKRDEQKLRLSEANLNATVNNTTLLIWSVDLNFNVIMSNEPFKQYIKEHHGYDLVNGSRIIPLENVDQESNRIRNKWQDRYKRALSGEIVKVTEETKGGIFEYSLCPIIDQKKITGVSIFAENVTQRVQKEKELSEANKKIGEFKLMALRSVMNPHFIFNALNSIQYFILDNDKLNAINYLSTFSKLIRGILSNTVDNKIKLSEEIEQLKYYINLEQLRFEDKFHFILNLDPELNIEEIEIPSLLIQPYVENAILHGLCNKQGQGTLKVTISENDDAILFEIEDDGIGREAAAEFRKQNLPKHKSMGTALTEERLKLINADSNVSFEITDLMQGGKPTGTNVKIWVKEA